MRRVLATVSTIALIASTMLATGGVASADPSAEDWRQLRLCESGDRYDINTGNGYYGAYQFDLSTWRSVGGTGSPHKASKAEQDYRALRLYRARGYSPWICAALVGLENDKDAGSGKMPSRSGSGGGSAGGSTSTPKPGKPATKAPAYPGKQLHPGDNSSKLAAFQKQMGAMGYGLTGTGYFGPKTEAAVRALQKKAGLNVVGYIGPKTWAAAWNTANKKGSAAPKSKYVPATNSSCKVGSKTALMWGGKVMTSSHTYRDLQCFQRQLGSRGYGLTGTGYFGSATKAAVLDLQKRNGIKASGVVDARTWKAAWEGKAKR